MLSWIVPQLRAELQDVLGDIRNEVIAAVSKFGPLYPALGIYSEDINYFDAKYNLIDTTCERLVQDLRFVDFVEFMANNRHDWTELASKFILEEQ